MEKNIIFTDDVKKTINSLVSVNTQMYFTSNTISISSESQNMIVYYDWNKTLEKDFGVYEVTPFLKILSMYNEPTLTITDNTILMKEGKQTNEFRNVQKSFITTPPDRVSLDENKISMLYIDPMTEEKRDIEMIFNDKIELPISTFNKISKNISILSTPHITIENNKIRCNENDNDSSNVFELELEVDNLQKCSIDSSNFMKIMEDDYTIYTSDMAMVFVGRNNNLTYIISSNI